jgi:hypothetical protein
MKATLLLAFTSIAATSPVFSEEDNFDKSSGAPSGWTSTMTGKGQPRWTVEKDATAPSKPNVLKQSGEATYPLLLKDKSSLQDGYVEVKFKAVSGKEDQAAGVVWRAKDKDNYYICRPNALEGNVVLYKTENGKRSPLDIVGRKGGYGVKTPVPPQQWQTLRVEIAGDTFTVKLDGKELFKVQDSTFKDPGMVGLWTKADSVTLFDDFKWSPAK